MENKQKTLRFFLKSHQETKQHTKKVENHTKNQKGHFNDRLNEVPKNAGSKSPGSEREKKKPRLTPGYRRTRSISPREGHRKNKRKPKKTKKIKTKTLPHSKNKRENPYSKNEKRKPRPHSKNECLPAKITTKQFDL